MKKTLALILALCMALAAVSAFAEDVTGTWYLVMFSLSAGTIDLNADGTFVMAVSASGDEQKYEGEWTAEGEKLALTVDGETLYLVSDGSSLNFSTDNIPADASESGLDLGALFSLISISREPGKLTLDEFTAYMNDRTLPEGVSEEDMAAVLRVICPPWPLWPDPATPPSLLPSPLRNLLRKQKKNPPSPSWKRISMSANPTADRKPSGSAKCRTVPKKRCI